MSIRAAFGDMLLNVVQWLVDINRVSPLAAQNEKRIYLRNAYIFILPVRYVCRL